MSMTVTVKEHVAVAPLASVTLKVLVVVPTGNDAPLANPPTTETTAPGQLSEPVGVA